MHTIVCCYSGHSGMADGESGWIQYHLAVFRMGQSDFVCVHPLDYNCLSGTAEETVYYHLGTCPVYDSGLLYLPVDISTGVRT